MKMYRSRPLLGATYVFEVMLFTRYYSLLLTFPFIVTYSGFDKFVWIRVKYVYAALVLDEHSFTLLFPGAAI